MTFLEVKETKELKKIITAELLVEDPPAEKALAAIHNNIIEVKVESPPATIHNSIVEVKDSGERINP